MIPNLNSSNLMHLITASLDPEHHFPQIDNEGTVQLFNESPDANPNWRERITAMVSPRTARRNPVKRLSKKDLRSPGRSPSPTSKHERRKTSKPWLTNRQIFKVLLGITDAINGRDFATRQEESITKIIQHILGEETTHLNKEHQKALTNYPGRFAEQTGLITNGRIFCLLQQQSLLEHTLTGGASMDLGRLIFGQNIRIVRPDGSALVPGKTHQHTFLSTLAKMCGVSNALCDEMMVCGRNWKNLEPVRKWLDSKQDQFGDFLFVINALSQVPRNNCCSILTKALTYKSPLLGKQIEGEVEPSLRSLLNKGSKADQSRMVHLIFSEDTIEIRQETDFYSSAKRVLKDGKWCEPTEDRGLVIRVDIVCRAPLKHLNHRSQVTVSARVNEYLSTADKKTIDKAEQILRENEWLQD